MVAFFHAIGNYAMRAKISMRVFFASRYYPQISTPNKVELRLEDEKEHNLDIVRFVNSELGAGPNKEGSRLLQIRQEVIKRASGVFIWVYLVVRILNKAYDHGDILALERKLRQIPNGLSLLFEEVLTRDDENSEAMKLCLRWILLARRPLKLRELYFAVHAGIHPFELANLNPDDISDEIMSAFILSSSRGLAEFTKSKTPVVQFIHETIREFFLKGNGVQHIQDTSFQSFLGTAHDSILTCCITYMSFAEPFLLTRSLCLDNSSRARKNLVDTDSLALLRKFPFIAYSLPYCLYHANAAEAGNKPQDSMLRTFNVSNWIHMMNVVRLYVFISKPRQDRRYAYSPAWSLVYIIAKHDLQFLLGAWKRIEPNATIDQGAPFSPIRVALERFSYDSVRVLMTQAWAIGPTDYRPTNLELSRLMYTYHNTPKAVRSSTTMSQLLYNWGLEPEILTLIRCGTFALEPDTSFTAVHAPLAFAADRGYESVTQYLLERSGVDCNRRENLGLTPLMRAARGGRSRIVSILLQCGSVAVDLKCPVERTALSYAAENGHETICRALFKHQQSQLSMRDKKGRTPFFYACMTGQEAIVTFFLTEAESLDIISEDNIGHTALSYAVMNGHENITKHLLRNQATQVNSQDKIHGRTPLIFALEFRYYSLARLLLARSDIVVSIGTKRGRNALHYAVDALKHAKDAHTEKETQVIVNLINAKTDDSVSDTEFSCDDGWEIE